MQNPYHPPNSNASRFAPAEPHDAITIGAVLLAPLAAFVFALILAAMAGIFIALFGALLSDENGDASLVFDLIFFPTFVWLPYLLCGFFAGRIAASRPVLNALYAGCIYLVANVAMALRRRQRSTL